MLKFYTKLTIRKIVYELNEICQLEIYTNKMVDEIQPPDLLHAERHQ